jgi:hypothetical protein
VQCPRNMWTVLRVYGAIGKDEFHNVWMYTHTETCGRIMLNTEMWDNIHSVPLLTLRLTCALETLTSSGTECSNGQINML